MNVGAAPGIHAFSWLTSGTASQNFDFFGLTDAPGYSITIVPEPATAALLTAGLVALAAFSRRRT